MYYALKEVFVVIEDLLNEKLRKEADHGEISLNLIIKGGTEINLRFDVDCESLHYNLSKEVLKLTIDAKYAEVVRTTSYYILVNEIAGYEFISHKKIEKE